MSDAGPSASERASGVPPSPFKGLTPYSEDDAEFFFGRDSDIRIIVANMLASRLTLLYGDSGVGKTSVLLAGVVPQLRAEARRDVDARGAPEFAVAVFRSWRDDPVQGVVRAVEDAVAELLGTNGEDTPSSLLGALEAATERVGGDVLVILDQFDEYFLYNGSEDGEGTFAVEFPRAVNRADLRVSFLVSIREDALAKLDFFKGRIPSLFENRLRLQHLDADDARAAIRGPIEKFNERVLDGKRVTVEPELVDAVVEQVGAGRVTLAAAGGGDVDGGASRAGDDRVEAPYLQLVLTRLWNEELGAGSRTLRMETLERCGGAERIVRTRLDEAMAALPPDERAVAARVFQYLVTRSGTKIAHTASDLSDFAGLPGDTVTPVVEHLAAGDVRLLRPVAPPPGQDGGPRYEIFHDVLGPAILEWRARHAQEEARRDAEERARRARRRARVFAALAVVSLVVMVLVGVLATWAVRERQNAIEQKRTADSNALVAEASAQLRVDPARSLDLLAAAIDARPTPRAEALLREALSESRARRVAPFAHDVTLIGIGRDGERIATAVSDGTIRVVGVGDTGSAVALRPPGTDVKTLAFDAAGNRVAYAGEDGRLHVADARSGVELWRAPGRRGDWPETAKFSRNGARLVTTYIGNSTAVVSDATTGRRIARLAHPLVIAADLDARGRTAVTVTHTGRMRVWNVAAERSLGPPRRLVRGAAVIALSPDGRFVAAADGKLARVWRARSGEPVAVLRGHAETVNSVDFRRDGELLVTASSDGTARVWETRTGLPAIELQGHAGTVFDAAFTADSASVATIGRDNTVRVWDVRQGRELRGHSGSVTALSFSPDGESVLTAGADGRVVRWNTRSGGEDEAIGRGSARPITDVGVSADGRRLAVATLDRQDVPTVIVRDVESAARVATLESYRARGGAYVGHFDTISSVSFGPTDGVVATSLDGSALVWNVRTERIAAELGRKDDDGFVQTHVGGALDAAFAASGSRVITVGEDDKARVWDARTGDGLLVFDEHDEIVQGVAANPRDEDVVVTASQDRTARVWDVRTGRELARLEHPRGVTAVAFSPDGERVATGGPDGAARVWEWRSENILGVFRVHADSVNALAFGSDGELIATASDDGTARLFSCGTCVDLERLRALARERLAALRG